MWVLIACAEAETKARAVVATPGGGSGDGNIDERPNTRGLT